MKKEKICAEIIHTELLAPEIHSMWIDVGQMASGVRAGQFVTLYTGVGGDKLLPRPISICEIKQKEGWIRLVFRVVGAGTREFANYRIGDRIHLLGPLGNGFVKREKEKLLIGGGIGIPPMLQLSKESSGKNKIVLGFRDQNIFLDKDFEQYGDVYIATEDGSVGTKGNVLDAVRDNGLAEGTEVIYACGPVPMLRGIKSFGRETGIETWISMEERMACGIGACLACVCRTNHIDEHTKVMNKRVCADGPVFLADEVEL
ncbi:MAG: dihydroorotate dehydrogenase electron transfer subunit [Lachnoclostridium sp.]|jgi:dihydroorotate dehydrogenase electron transfer subunit|nr:dihydroorotate dehydrogenase electron transfer subunit [Lachnoclostridium sp.]